MLLFFIIKESFYFALQSLITNKLRTFLSLLGITIGIMSIISVFTLIDALESNISKSISTLGSNILYIQKWPWRVAEKNYPWWNYIKRPTPTVEEYNQLKKRSQYADAVCFMLNTQQAVSYKGNNAENIQTISGTYELKYVRNFEIENGRYFTPYESQSGKNSVILGHTLAERLFDNKNPIGEIIKIDHYKVKVIGVFKYEGDNLFGFTIDEKMVIPYHFARYLVDTKNTKLDQSILIKTKENIPNQLLIDELTGIMRAVRQLKPAEENDFAINETDLISKGFDSIFVIIDIAGGIIGAFSILVGGFGITNIMFVSVKEQTKQIGIRKAIGAKKNFILLEFLFEAVILSLIGGIVGLFIVFLLTLVSTHLLDFEVFLNLKNSIFGTVFSIFIGLIAGIVPAWKASRLNPVIAINTV